MLMRASIDHLDHVHRRVAKGEYRVSSTRVAAAMLQRIGAMVLDREVSGSADRGRVPLASGHRHA